MTQGEMSTVRETKKKEDKGEITIPTNVNEKNGRNLLLIESGVMLSSLAMKGVTKSIWVL